MEEYASAAWMSERLQRIARRGVEQPTRVASARTLGALKATAAMLSVQPHYRR